MTRKAKSKNNSKKWFVLALLGVFLAAPNASVIKIALEDTNPLVFNTYRYAIVLLLTLPFLIMYMAKMNRRAFRAGIEGGIYMAIAVFAYVWAIQLSQASYVSIVTLLTPLVFIALSARLTGEKISRRGLAGITLAALGAMLIVVLPTALHQQGNVAFYPWATVLALVNCIAFPLCMIRYKQANEAGMPLNTIMAITALLIVILSTAVGLFLYGTGPFVHLSHNAIYGIVYSGIVVALVARIISVIAYERIGSVVSGALAYLETLIAILLPVLWLNEVLSTEMVIGGIVILIGVYIAEHHKSVAHKHFLTFRHH